MARRQRKSSTRKKRRTRRKKVEDPVSSAISAVNKKFSRKSDGNAPALRMSDHKFLASVGDGVSTQCLSLDLAIGRPGVPCGRVTEIYGLESTAKSALAVQIMREAQRRGGIAILTDSEAGYEPDRVVELGVDPEKLIVLQPRYIEEMFDQVETAIKALPDDLHPIVWVWDSVAGLSPMQEYEGKAEDSAVVGGASRAISRGLRKFIRYIADRRIAAVFVNQLRDNIGAVGWGVEKYKTFGGHAIRYHASLRIRLRKLKVERDSNKKPSGARFGVKIDKNKVGPPFGEGEFFFAFRSGIDRVRDLIDVGVEYGILEEGRGTVGYEGVTCRPSAFKEKILPEIGGATKLKKMILKEAYKAGIWKPYGKSFKAREHVEGEED